MHTITTLRAARLGILFALLASFPSDAARAQPGGTTQARLPNLAQGYYQVEGVDVRRSAEGLRAVLGRYMPSGTAGRALSLLGGAATCVQEQDVVAFRLYFQRGDPWAAGIVAVVSRANARDRSIWFRCAKQAVLGGGPGEAFSPCASSFADARFSYFYSGTKQSVCADVRGELEPGRTELGSAGPRPAGPSGPVYLRPPAGAPGLVFCSQFVEPGQYGQQVGNVITVYPPDIIGQGGRDLGGTYSANLLQWAPGSGGWVPVRWPPSQQGQSLVFARMPRGVYAIQLGLEWPDEATGQATRATVVVAQYASPRGTGSGGCAF